MTNFYYIYCLKDKHPAKFSLKGIDEKRVYTLGYKNIEAVLTEVNSKEFESQKVKAKLEKDLKWTEEKVRNHQVVIEEAMKTSTVIPLKFLTLYKTEEKVKKVLEEKYNEFRELLDKLRGKEEWGLKVYVVDKEKLAEAIKKGDEELIKMGKEITEKPEGVKYFFEKQIEEKVKEKLDEQLDGYIKEVFDILAPFSVEKPVINKVLPVELTGKNKETTLREMILNISYLISKEKVGEFQKTVERIHHNIYFPKGLWLEYSGPWPPYNFAQTKFQGSAERSKQVLQVLMEKGFYLYCIRSQTAKPIEVVKTISGEGKVYIISYNDIEAVVSEVDLNEFGSEEIQKKAEEDLNWIKEKAQIHEYVIEQVMRVGPNLISVIPMKFGTIFKTEESLKECLRKNYQQFKDSLEKLKGKQEWGVKIYLKENIFRKTIEDKNEAVLAKKKEIESLPKGMAFFTQKQIGEIVNQEKDKELDRITEEIYESLGQLAFSKNKSKLLEKDFTGMLEEMLLNAFYLIEESKLASFQKKVGELKEKYNSLGFKVEVSGPWPSYHFA